MKKLSIIAAAFTAIGAVTASLSFAGPLNDAQSTCAAENCQAMIIRGTVQSAQQRHGRWIEQVYAPAGACLRLEVTASSPDLETVVVTPTGAIFQDDDSGAGLFPLVKIASASAGYHTVSIGQDNGAAESGDFVLRYGVYNNGNANCTSPTPPTSLSRSTK